MNWASWADFFAMGGYALYVWGSYGAAAGLIVVEIVLLRNRQSAALAACRTKVSDSLLTARPPTDFE